VLNHVKSLALPYTIIDIGWWFQLTLPTSFFDVGYGELPGTIPGDGNVLSAFTDSKDVGKFVAKTILDPRTINKSVFCYSEMLTMNQVFDILDKTTGRKFDRNFVCWPQVTRFNIRVSLTETS
jgi:nucleoside-diphosphate-sugar epimerase